METSVAVPVPTSAQATELDSEPQSAASAPAVDSDELDSLLASLDDTSGDSQNTSSDMDADLAALLADL